VSAILVTGGLGYVGSHFVWAAASAGVRSLILDDGSTAGEPLLPPGVEVVRGDIGDGDLIRRTCSRIRAEAIVHFAGKALVGESMRDPGATFDVNVTRSLRLLEAALAAGVGSIVFSSSAAVYGEPERVPIPEGSPTRPLNPYGASKLCFEAP